MEYTYTNLPDWFAKYTVQALDDRFVFRYKTLVSDVQSETHYKDMSGKLVRGKQGNAFWSSAAFAVILLWVVFYWIAAITCPNWLDGKVRDVIFYSALILGGIFFALRFIKEEYVWFYDKANSAELAIKITSKNREQAEQFIKFIESKIQEANSHPQTK